MFSIIGRKVGMTQMFSEGGDLVPATAIEVEPNLVLSIKTREKDGYSAVSVGYGKIRENLLNKPDLGQFKKREIDVRRHLYELKSLDVSKYKTGDFVNLQDLFKVGDLIDVQGVTRGHGFTGAIKLWNFACGPRSHGAGYPHRFGGSLETGRGGMSPQKVWKGKKMARRYGSEKVMAVNLEVLYVDYEKNLLFVRGCIPGRSDSIVKLKPTSRKRKSMETPFKTLKKDGN